MGMCPFCKDDREGIRRRGGKRSKCCSIKIKNYSLNSKLKWTAAATRKKKETVRVVINSSLRSLEESKRKMRQ